MGIFAYGDLVREINGCEFHEVTNQGKSAQPLGQTSLGWNPEWPTWSMRQCSN